MDKRSFFRLDDHEQSAEIEAAARAVNGALNLFGRETVEDLMSASWDESEAEAYIRDITTVGPDFSAAFVASAMPACNLYLRYSRYRRECIEARQHAR